MDRNRFVVLEPVDRDDDDATWWQRAARGSLIRQATADDLIENRLVKEG